jgi:phosphoribosylamine-glycine ligase
VPKELLGDFIASHGAPIVVKADGLAAGKGVTVATDPDTAYRAAEAALVERRLGAAGLEIIVEDCPAGGEASFFALVDEPALCVVMAARGYPDEPEYGSEIRGLETAAADPKVKIFHAGTRRDGERLLAAGGRVLGVTALGQDLAAARARAYTAVDRIDWPQGFCRREIGLRSTR